MRTVYHGTNESIIAVINNPQSNTAINGTGFFMTEDIDTARSYGKMYIKVIISDEMFEQGKTQPIDQRYTHAPSGKTYEQCAKMGMETIFTAHQARQIMSQGEVFKAYSHDMIEFPHSK